MSQPKGWKQKRKVADVAVAASPTPESLEAVNGLLKGKVASIELADGRTIKKAKKVTMEPNFTYWQANGKDQKVETDQVLRVSTRSKSKGLLGLGAGAAAGGLLALVTGAGDPSCNEIGQCTSDAGSEQTGAAVVLGALIGFGVAKMIPRKETVVYRAQVFSASDSEKNPPVAR